MFILQQGVNADPSANLKSIAARKTWESVFQQTFLLPILSHVDENITETRRTLMQQQQMNDLEK